MGGIPIIQNHDSLQVLGVIDFHSTYMLARFMEEVTTEQFFAIFGAVGMKPINPRFQGEKIYFKSAEIYEFSLVPTAVVQLPSGARVPR